MIDFSAIANNNLNAMVPTEFVLENAYPNPFNPTTNIRYGLSENTNVNIMIYDMTGRLVSKYDIGEKSPGWYNFQWNGTDHYDQKVGTGMYFLTIVAENIVKHQKVTFLK